MIEPNNDKRFPLLGQTWAKAGNLIIPEVIKKAVAPSQDEFDIGKRDVPDQSMLESDDFAVAVLEPLVPEEAPEPPRHILDDLLASLDGIKRGPIKDGLDVIQRLAQNAPRTPTSLYESNTKVDLLGIEAQLRDDHPGFEPVIEFLFDELLLSLEQEKPRPCPLIILGPPGIGKTYFATNLAAHLKIPQLLVSLASLDASFCLTGTSSTWSNARSSQFLDLIAQHNNSSGLFFMDEVGESRSDLYRNHPITPMLLELLDSEQSSRFRDNYFQYSMDLSGWVKILAGNSLGSLDTPIVDRCHVIRLPRLTSEQQRKVITRMAGKLPVSFADEAIDELNASQCSLRQLGGYMRKAASKAVRRGSDQINAIDIRRLQIKPDLKI